MLKQGEKPNYWDNHEGFRRLLIMGGVCLVFGVFFGDVVGPPELRSVLEGWFPIMMWVMGAIILVFCFVLHPRQYSIYEECLAVEWWYPRRKVIPFDDVTELKAWTSVGRRHIIVLSRGRNHSFGFEAIAPRKIEVFAERLEEAVNRRRFQAGREPIQLQAERTRKKKRKDGG